MSAVVRCGATWWVAAILWMVAIAPVPLSSQTSGELLGTSSGVPSVIRVAWDPAMVPLGQVSREIMEHMADATSMTVHWVAVPLHRGERLLLDGHVDVVLGVPYNVRRAGAMEFTDPYLSSSVALLVPRHNETIATVEDLTGRVVAVRGGSGELDYLQNVWRINFNVVSTLDDALDLLSLERADVVAGDRIVLRSLLDARGATSQFRFASSWVMPLEYTMAVRSENYALLNRLNVSLARTVGSNVYQEILERWLIDDVEPLRLRRLLRIIVLLLMAILLVFIASLWWNRTLKLEVARKTRETRTMSGMMEQIMRNSPRGLITIDRAGTIAAANDRAAALLGESAALRGIPWMEVPILRQIVEPRVQQVLEEGKQYVGGELHHTRGGVPLDIRFTLYAGRDDRGAIASMVVTLEDITEELRRREQDVEREKSRVLHQVVAGIAHEIRNPLTSIKTYIELLPTKMHNHQFRENIAVHVPREIDRVSQLIESLINYARPAPPQGERFDMADLLGSSVVLFQPVFTARGFALHHDLAAGSWVYADPNQIKQVMINFLLNGLGALEDRQAHDGPPGTAAPPSMTVKCCREGSSVVVELADEGIGMHEEEMAIMLDPFYTTKDEGTGLGLTLSKRYLEENHGTMTFHSARGAGTTVVVRFAADDAPEGTP